MVRIPKTSSANSTSFCRDMGHFFSGLSPPLPMHPFLRHRAPFLYLRALHRAWQPCCRARASSSLCKTACENVPRKHLAARPHALTMEGAASQLRIGVARALQINLKSLRRAFLDLCLSARADKRLMARASIPAPEPLFSATEVEQARALVFSGSWHSGTFKCLVHPPLPANVSACV